MAYVRPLDAPIYHRLVGRCPCQRSEIQAESSEVKWVKWIATINVGMFKGDPNNLKLMSTKVLWWKQNIHIIATINNNSNQHHLCEQSRRLALMFLLLCGGLFLLKVGDDDVDDVVLHNQSWMMMKWLTRAAEAAAVSVSETEAVDI